MKTAKRCAAGVLKCWSEATARAGNLVFRVQNDGIVISKGVVFSNSATGTITLTTGPLPIAHDLNINGPGANVLTVSGNNSSRVFQVTNAAFVIISGLTIAQGFTSGGGTGGGGSGSGSGGGIYNGLNLALTNCTLVNNIAGGSLFDFGGAIHDNGTTTTLRNC